MSTTLTDFELPNVATGPDPFRLSEYAAEDERRAIVLLFQRDYHCGNCREQVQEIARRYDEFEALDADVVSVLPEPADRTQKWNDQYDLPFPLLADERKDAADAYDQPTRFGVLGSLHDIIGRMPETVVIDTRGTSPAVAHIDRGEMPADRPSVDELLETVADLVDAEA
jgi:peroxiredoxin Q/BCP